MSKFTIGFWELCFLAEVCIPPVPIARAKFWEELTDVYWQRMSEIERKNLREFLSNKYTYKKGLEEKVHEIEIFDARFNPENQYTVKSADASYMAFQYKGRYYVGTRRWIMEDKIVSIEKYEFQPHKY